ncbi:MAG: RNA polymerase sigma factor [Planctomycetota bacterium]|jgi:RNA polymerase sigma-70 factor (ECF subfamily)
MTADREFIKRLVARDERAYEVLLDKYEAPVYRFFYYSQGNHQIAQDQCGETFARFVTSIENFKSNDSHSLKAFIFGIARNILLETFRKKRLAREDVSLLEEVPSGRPSVFRQVSSPDELEYVMNIIAQFKDAERQILLLRFVEGLKLDEIAGIMKMPLNSVKSHVHRSRKKLCEILSKSTSYQREA